jgi:hypothetical protein
MENSFTVTKKENGYELLIRERNPIGADKYHVILCTKRELNNLKMRIEEVFTE